MSTATEQQPWVEAAWDCVPLAAVPPPEYIRIIKLACERHAAALTQENQRLQERLEHQRTNLMEAARCELARIDHELDRVKADRDRWEASWHKDTEEGNARYSELFGKLEAARAALRVARPFVAVPGDDGQANVRDTVLDQIDAALEGKEGKA